MPHSISYRRGGLDFHYCGYPYYYWCASGPGMVIVLTLRAPGHAGGGCGSDSGPNGFDGEARSPSGYCEGGSNEFEFRVCPYGRELSGAKSAVDACQGREQPPPTTESAKAAVMVVFTRITYAPRSFPGCSKTYSDGAFEAVKAHLWDFRERELVSSLEELQGRSSSRRPKLANLRRHAPRSSRRSSVTRSTCGSWKAWDCAMRLDRLNVRLTRDAPGRC